MMGYPTAPFATIKLDGDADKFRKNIRNQFNQICYGDIYDELLEVCKILKIVAITC